MSRITPAERRALEAVLKHGSQKAAAHALGRSQRTIEQQLRSARVRLDVGTTLEAVRKLFIEGE